MWHWIIPLATLAACSGLLLVSSRSNSAALRNGAMPTLVAIIGLALWDLACTATGTEIFPTPLDTARAFGELF